MVKKNYKALRVGNKIKLIKIPQIDIEQRERELQNKSDMPGLTADTLEKILENNPVVRISEIDELGNPWFDYELLDNEGVRHYHSIRIIDNDSWEYLADK